MTISFRLFSDVRRRLGSIRGSWRRRGCRPVLSLDRRGAVGQIACWFLGWVGVIYNRLTALLIDDNLQTVNLQAYFAGTRLVQELNYLDNVVLVQVYDCSFYCSCYAISACDNFKIDHQKNPHRGPGSSGVGDGEGAKSERELTSTNSTTKLRLSRSESASRVATADWGNPLYFQALTG